MFKKIIFAISLSLLIQVPTLALEIDLTSFASGDSVTHSHSYVLMKDNQYHWQECSLCKQIKDKAEHSLTISYTHPTMMCHTDNKKVEQCSSCSYFVSESYVQEHPSLRKYTAHYVVNNATGLLGYVPAKACTVCSIGVGGESARDKNGNIIDWSVPQTYPLEIYDSEGILRVTYQAPWYSVYDPNIDNYWTGSLEHPEGGRLHYLEVLL